jgi:thioredoxin-related protein
MKKFKLFLFVSLMLIFTDNSFAQKIYNPENDAKKDIAEAVTKAKEEGKHVLIQVGGNWCPWCIKLHNFLNSESEINQLLTNNYIFIVVNYSKENKNTEVLKELEFPQRFGFPVMVVLDQNGKRIHTQNTGILEQEKGYELSKVKSFLINWRPEALNPDNYK